MNNPDKTELAVGGCLCGAVRYEVRGRLRDIVACHCTQCRKSTGHYYAATAARRENFTLTEQRGLRWYRSSAAARRGFCGECGSVLFWDNREYPHISITAGSLYEPTDLVLVKHIFVAEKGDYYTIADGLPQVEGRGHGIAIPEG